MLKQENILWGFLLQHSTIKVNHNTISETDNGQLNVFLLNMLFTNKNTLTIIICHMKKNPYSIHSYLMIVHRMVQPNNITKIKYCNG